MKGILQRSNKDGVLDAGAAEVAALAGVFGATAVAKLPGLAGVAGFAGSGGLATCSSFGPDIDFSMPQRACGPMGYPAE
jgi:hypothetical protein